MTTHKTAHTQPAQQAYRQIAQISMGWMERQTRDTKRDTLLQSRDKRKLTYDGAAAEVQLLDAAHQRRRLGGGVDARRRRAAA